MSVHLSHLALSRELEGGGTSRASYESTRSPVQESSTTTTRRLFMLSWIQRLRRVTSNGSSGLRRASPSRSNCRRPHACRLALEELEGRVLLATTFKQANLVSDVPGMAQT